MTYTLITANRNYSSWSLRPWLLMKALSIDFTDRIEPFTHSVNAHFAVFSPTAQVPVLLDGARRVHDSLAIALYLADRHAGIWPTAIDARAWSQSAVAEMHAGFGALRHECPMNVGVRAILRQPSAALEKDLARMHALLSPGMRQFGGPWLAGGDFTLADAYFAPVAYRARTYTLALGDADMWVARILAHPAMRTWETAALAEPWREAAHEGALAALGTVTADYRTS